MNSYYRDYAKAAYVYATDVIAAANSNNITAKSVKCLTWIAALHYEKGTAQRYAFCNLVKCVNMLDELAKGMPHLPRFVKPCEKIASAENGGCALSAEILKISSLQNNVCKEGCKKCAVTG